MWFLSFIFFIPIILIGFTIKYLRDVSNTSNCNKINSSVLSFYYYYYWFDLIIFLLLFILSLSVLLSISTEFKKFYKLIKNTSKYEGKVGYNYIHSFVSIFLTVFFIKLLYDVSNEEECKDVDPGLRTFLIVVNSISIITVLGNMFIM
jgi:hypothetical protein